MPARSAVRRATSTSLSRCGPTRLFRREGYDLHLDVPISFAQASLGTRLSVPTLKATKEIVIPPGTQPNEVIRLKGEGVPYPKGARQGDLLVEVG